MAPYQRPATERHGPLDLQRRLHSLRVGILGGGQLGLMLLQAAADLSLDVAVLDPDPEAPARRYTRHFVEGSFQEYDTVVAFGKGLDVLTIELEAVNLEALYELERQGVRVYPQPDVVGLIQDKARQKAFYARSGLPTAEYALIEGPEDLQSHRHLLPAYQKLARGGYDGRGVKRIESEADFAHALPGPGYLEQAIEGARELCVIVARSATREIALYPAVESFYHPEANLVDYLRCPAHLAPALAMQARMLARHTAEALGIVGLLAVEMFLTAEGDLLVNEVAPRPHNTGHTTIEAHDTSQYSQHWRAILGLPLGSTAVRHPGGSALINLIGEPGSPTGPTHYHGLERVLAEPGVFVHLYGKTHCKPYRKMGHMTILARDSEPLDERVARIRGMLTLTGSSVPDPSTV